MSHGFTIARLAAALILVLAAGRWPYAYYQLLRWLVSLTAAYGIYRCFRQASSVWVWTFAAMAVLFNPLAPIYLARTTWRMVDPAAALVMMVSIAALRAKASAGHTGWTPEELEKLELEKGGGK
jgi:hypothetical protein